jgi:hypothetical protein
MFVRGEALELKRGRPSRSTQLVIIAVLLLGSAAVVFGPSISPTKRAESLYLDGWFSGVTTDEKIEVNEDFRRAHAYRCFEKALGIQPDRYLYQQALIWCCPRDSLLKLTQERHLGKSALVLAYGLLCTPKGMNDRGSRSPDVISTELRRADMLKRLDPSNAVPYYRKAFVLTKAGRQADAASEIRAGNRTSIVREYYPIVPDEIVGSPADPMIQESKNLSPFAEDDSAYCAVSQSLIAYAKNLSIAGRKDEARDVLQECCRMGMKTATASPRTAAAFQRGSQLFDAAWTALKSIQPQPAKLARLSFVMDESSRYVANWLISNPAIESASRIPTFRAEALRTASEEMIMAVYAVLVTSLWWLLWFAAGHSDPENAPDALPWNEGWLARSFTSLQIPACILTAYFLYLTKLRGFTLVDESWNDLLPMLPWCLAEVGMLLLVLRRLHDADNSCRERKSGWIRFIFGGPASRQAWIAKYVGLTAAAQVLYISSLFLLTVIVCKPILGVHPWQLQRLPVYDNLIKDERSMIEWIDLKVYKASPREWRLGL